MARPKGSKNAATIAKEAEMKAFLEWKASQSALTEPPTEPASEPANEPASEPEDVLDLTPIAPAADFGSSPISATPAAGSSASSSFEEAAHDKADPPGSVASAVVEQAALAGPTDEPDFDLSPPPRKKKSKPVFEGVDLSRPPKPSSIDKTASRKKESAVVQKSRPAKQSPPVAARRPLGGVFRR